jgi:Cutinase
MRLRRSSVLASALGVLGILATWVAGAGSASAAPAVYGRCAALQVIAVRGTTEAQPAGGLLPPLTTQITTGTSRTVLTYGLPYPATPDWGISVRAGTSALANRLAISAAYCPDQRFVLAGYSQGAWVIGDALAGGGGAAPTVSAALGRKVTAIVLYGDPRFRAGEPYNRGTFQAGVSGVLPRAQGSLSAYASRIRSYCYADDTVCQNGSSGSGHIRYARVTQDAAGFAVNRAGG